MAQPENVQFNYFFQMRDGVMSEHDWDELGISVDDRNIVPVAPGELRNVAMNGFLVNDDGSVPTIYVSPLTPAMIEKLEANPRTTRIMKVPATEQTPLFPEGVSDSWTRADYGELWIPQKGKSIKLDDYTWKIYNRCIRNYEGHDDAYIKDGTVYIDGKPAKTYTFAMDYYFMMGDNRDNSADSRYWGFVPEDHIVGKPWRVLVSFDKDKSLLNGGVRWERVLKPANPDK